MELTVEFLYGDHASDPSVAAALTVKIDEKDVFTDHDLVWL